MNHRTYEFVQLDVFTQTKLAGNQLAVFTDARGLTDEEMQALAREMNFSETTFILPREPDVENQAGKKVRIFTVSEELPFAGHPTLGTSLYLRSQQAHNPNAADEVTLDLRVGKIPVKFTPKSEGAGRDCADGQVFGEMRQRDPEFGMTFSREQMADAIGVGVDQLAADWPAQVVSTGLPFAIVPIRSLDALTNTKFNIARTSEVLKPTDARFCYFIYPERHGDTLEVRARMIFYGGEDPATGSAAGCAASWMVQHGVANPDEHVVVRQGIEIRRPSELYVRASREGDRVTNVRVGGYAVEILRGSVTL
ncbi:MAG TPA: PhzF family phenazine biosynthesis protein [Chthoniobacterales bacterium]|jgi:trans-2,3-dihydro-3-hydroxyanthranilate isomerase